MSAYVGTVVLFRFITIPAATVVVPCARLSRRKCGWMPAGKMYLTPLTFISYLQFRISSIRSFTVIRSSCMIPCITPLLLQSVNWRLTQSTLVLLLDISASCIHGGSEMNFHPHIHTILLGGWIDTQKMNGRITALNFSFQSRSFPKYSVENTWKN